MTAEFIAWMLAIVGLPVAFCLGLMVGGDFFSYLKVRREFQHNERIAEIKSISDSVERAK